MSKWTRKSRALVVVVAILCSQQLALAQTDDQLRRLEGLTPAQREALLDALDDPGGRAVSPGEQQLSNPPVVAPRAVDVPETGKLNHGGLVSGGMEYPSLADLPRFGYDLFAGEPSTFAPATDIPVPVDYVIGPGDTIELQLFGSENALYSLVVGRDGVLNVPAIGPVSVSGLRFSELVSVLQQRVAEQMIGVSASITMGPLRSIRIFVLGDAHRPGSYTVSALSTLTNALFVSGGIDSIGSLRKVQLKRNGRTVTSLDLYDLLLRGDTSGDVRLQPGDVIFVPPAGAMVGIGGEVRRPAVYELKGESTVSDLLSLAGGMLASAYPQASQISRISPERERVILDVDLSSAGGLATELRADDLVTVYSVLDKREDIVRLQGHVYRAGPYQWNPGMRITDLVKSVRDLQPQADLPYVLIRREDPVGQPITALSVNLAEAFARPGSPIDIPLRPLDQVTVFREAGDRSPYLEPILADLRLQAKRGMPAPQVRVNGRVRAPGTYPLESGMRITDLLRAGGSLAEAAYDLEAELARYEIGGAQQRSTRLVKIDLAAALAGDREADIRLQPYDILTIREIPLWEDSAMIAVEGEVRFPGTFPIQRGERLSSIISRAGGLTELAFPDGAIFLRTDLRQREQQQIDELSRRLEAEIESESIAEGDAGDSSGERALLEQVRETQATGRLVIDLDAVVSGSASDAADIALRDGDRLLIPRESQTVTIIGEVQFPTSHVYEPGLSRNQYIDRSGGTTALADEKRIYVVKADGSVVASRRSLFFRRRDMAEIQPGDTIVVPIKPDPMSTLSLWTSVTTVIYNIGVAAAAVASF